MGTCHANHGKLIGNTERQLRSFNISVGRVGSVIERNGTGGGVRVGTASDNIVTDLGVQRKKCLSPSRIIVETKPLRRI